MDEDYKRLAKEKHAAAKRKLETEEKQQSVRDRHQEQCKSQCQHLENLKALGYSARDAQKLGNYGPFDRCINWTPQDWQGQHLPFAHAVHFDNDMTVGFNLKHTMLLEDMHGHSDLQSQIGLGLTEEQWKGMKHHWDLVNPFPTPVTDWKSYRAHVDPQPIGEAVANQLAGLDPAANKQDLRGCGIVRVPKEVYDEIQERLPETYWSSTHPFLVIQLAFIDFKTKLPRTDYAVVPVGSPPAADGTMFLSPAVKTRTGLTTGDALSARFVTVLPVCPSQKGIGIQLEFVPTQSSVYSINHGLSSSSTPGENCIQNPPLPSLEQQLELQLTKELEKQYILVQNQWVVLETPAHGVWLYWVKQLWNFQNRPVQVASLYGAQVSIQINLPQLPSSSSASPDPSLDLMDVITCWDANI